MAEVKKIEVTKVGWSAKGKTQEEIDKHRFEKACEITTLKQREPKKSVNKSMLKMYETIQEKVKGGLIMRPLTLEEQNMTPANIKKLILAILLGLK
jgi:hypothetical protein